MQTISDVGHPEWVSIHSTRLNGNGLTSCFECYQPHPSPTAPFQPSQHQCQPQLVPNHFNSSHSHSHLNVSASCIYIISSRLPTSAPSPAASNFGANRMSQPPLPALSPSVPAPLVSQPSVVLGTSFPVPPSPHDGDPPQPWLQSPALCTPSPSPTSSICISAQSKPSQTPARASRDAGYCTPARPCAPAVSMEIIQLSLLVSHADG